MSDNQEQSLASSEQTVAPRLIVILGGARSGKSAFAERLAAGSERSVAFIATATAGDDEMRSRIARHRASRPKGWYTLEEWLDLASAVRRAGELADVLLLDCVTLWLGNVLLQESVQHEKDDEVEFHTAGRLFNERALKECEALLAVVKSLSPDKTLIVVTNEVGLGIVPDGRLGRWFRDGLGVANQRLAGAADEVVLLACGIPLTVKPQW